MLLCGTMQLWIRYIYNSGLMPTCWTGLTRTLRIVTRKESSGIAVVAFERQCDGISRRSDQQGTRQSRDANSARMLARLWQGSQKTSRRAFEKYRAGRSDAHERPPLPGAKPDQVGKRTREILSH